MRNPGLLDRQSAHCQRRHDPQIRGRGLTHFRSLVNNGTVDVQVATIRYESQDKTFNNGCRFTSGTT